MLPMVLGHEMVGEVVAAGPGTTDTLGREIRPGDRIGWSESTCGAVPRLRDPARARRLRKPGLRIPPARRPVPVRHRRSGPATATSRPARRSCCCRTTSRTPGRRCPAARAKPCCARSRGPGGIRPNATVVVQGAGALGVFATAVARLCGAGVVITVGGPSTRLEAAERFGATATVVRRLHSGGPRRAGAGADRRPRRRPRLRLRGRPDDRRGGRRVRGAARDGRDRRLDRPGARSRAAGHGDGQGADRSPVRSTATSPTTTARWSSSAPSPAGCRGPSCSAAPVGLAGASAAVESMSRLGELKAVIDPRLP